jgi:hypothetical protein
MRRDLAEQRSTAAQATGALVLLGAAAILVSGWVHFYLYFRGGYRGIHREAVAGITVSRAFALNAIAAVVIAQALVCSLRWRALLLPAAVTGLAFAASTLLAYALSRTVGLLGFEESTTSAEAVLGLVAETAAIILLFFAVTGTRRTGGPLPAGRRLELG